MGAGASTLPAAVDKSTAQGFAGDKFDEAAFDKCATDGSVPKEVIVAAATAPGEGVDFSKLQTAPDGFFSIPDTARRAVNLDQLKLIAEHCCRELGYDLIVNECQGCHGGKFRDVEIKKKEEGEGKVWYVGRFKEGKFGKEPLRDPHQVNLYDCATYVIHPATKPKEASMVEIMCVTEQPPDFFVSHFWGEPIIEFLKCLYEHCGARGLTHEDAMYDGDSMKPHPFYVGDDPNTGLAYVPRYWVCAHANNQHKLAGEIVDDLSQTSFARAINLAKGTVSVIDTGAVSYTRLWCVFELYRSLVAAGRDYVYDMATATPWKGIDKVPAPRGEDDVHGATCILDGLGAWQLSSEVKAIHESHFPLGIIDQGITFDVKEGNASVEADKVNIFKGIGDKDVLLNETVHGRTAAAVLRLALEEGGSRKDKYLEAFSKGHVRKLALDLGGSDVDTEDTWKEVIDRLDPETLEDLSIRSVKLNEIPISSLAKYGKLTKFSLDQDVTKPLPADLFAGAKLTNIRISNTRGIETVPSFKGLPLTHLNLNYMNSLKTLEEDSFAGSALQHFALTLANELQSIPAGLFAGLGATLTFIEMSNVKSITSIPDGLFAGLTSLKQLDFFGLCAVASEPPENLFAGLTSLKKLTFGGVGETSGTVTTLPEGLFNGLSSLEELTLGRGGFTSLPAGLFTDKGLVKLEKIRITYCEKLTDLPVTIFDGMDKSLGCTVDISDCGRKFDEIGEHLTDVRVILV